MSMSPMTYPAVCGHWDISQTAPQCPDEIVNFDQRIPVKGGTFAAWGYLTYTRSLTAKQADDYELRPAPDNPDRPRPILEQMKRAAKLAQAERGQSAPKKNAPDRGER